MPSTGQNNNNPQGVHFVGSLPLPTTRDVFKLLGSTMASHIGRMPDGEPASRGLFVAFQRELFLPYPQLINTRHNPTPTSGQPLPNVDEVTRYLETLETGYDAAAIESYATFAEMRAAGVIPPGGVKFQVCIATPLNTITATISQNYKAYVEPHYTAALVRSLERIQAEIPHADLAVQIDCAHEFAVLEEVWTRMDGMERSKPWWCDVDSNHHHPADGEEEEEEEDLHETIFRGVVDRIVSFAGGSHIAGDVELGLHLCYGDFGHKHFIEPTDMGMMVRVALAVLPRLARRLDYIHMPVPKERDDAAYFAPLRKLLPLLREGGTVLYLGLVRENDEAGTKRRIETARKVIDGLGEQDRNGGGGGGGNITWGIATECGMGRMKPEDVPGTLEMMKKLARPIR
ncbi:uncharacterized protein Z520_10748 [Fonsecaea multimorphosa CBS 102226]|uniref:Xylose isomerase-like TIM barrel domain-containing protein n=1 Tax=Fonsecaea multimorphosa CBS 102226 TaxID=1442371 RepID=A0A0D2GVF1_9EURO|nr:uncharacterized protein Z520_10748 [Fonsecaea multimorphosa CBS 102226]KIX93570.1 hypothetical protein Z520_10748 [Fonsecaea multimorphosa CBS 102226]OAL18882.1 hypothetical protein AYO22_10211 [Fonsecaea multimorphosa]